MSIKLVLMETQRKLNNRGYSLTVDGLFGLFTAKAINDYIKE